MVLYQFKIIQHLLIQSLTMRPSTTNLWRRKICNFTAHLTALYKIVSEPFYQVALHKFVSNLMILSCEYLPISMKFTDSICSMSKAHNLSLAKSQMTSHNCRLTFLSCHSGRKSHNCRLTFLSCHSGRKVSFLKFKWRTILTKVIKHFSVEYFFRVIWGMKGISIQSLSWFK